MTVPTPSPIPPSAHARVADPSTPAEGLALRLTPAAAWLVGVVGFAAVTALFVHGTNGFPLGEPDEARYGEVAREILVRGDWVTPHLNFVKYFEKPPLVYWATAASYAAFGISEFTARLPVVVSGLATVALTVVLAARMYGAATALIALPILALGPLFAVLGVTLTLDMPLTAFVTLAMAAVWCGWVAASSSGEALAATVRGAPRTWYRIAYVATAFAILVKGPVAAVLVGGSALVFLLLHGGWRALRPTFDVRGMVLALVVALPWFVLVSWRNPEFLHFFVVEQHVARYLWTNEHDQPFWFFLPAIPVALAPFGLMVLLDPPLLRSALAPQRWAPATRFLAIWAAVVVAFFSLSTSKLLTYILPAMPPLAVLAARAIERGIAAGRTAGLRRIAWLLVLMGLLTSLCGAVLTHLVDHWRVPLLVPYLLAGGAVLALTGWLVGRGLRRWGPAAALGILAIGWFVAIAVAISGRGAANDYRALGLAARAALGPDDRIAMYNHLVNAIPFYSQRRTIMVGRVGELQFGSGQGDQSQYFWNSDDALRREWAGPGRLFLVINRVELAAIDPPLSPTPIVLATKDKKLLLVNR